MGKQVGQDGVEVNEQVGKNGDLGDIEDSDLAASDAKPRVLIVEDVDALRNALQEQLFHLGYTCVCASNCAEGDALARRGGFACALIDLGLPDGSGLSLIEKFHEYDPAMVPVILTGQSDPEIIIDAMRAGAFDYIVKPAKSATLRVSIARAVQHHKLIHERAVLAGLLHEERDQLKVKIEAATADVRDYARSCEASNALLHGLLSLTQISSELHGDEQLIQSVYQEIARHMPLKCVALCAVARKELLAAFGDGSDGVDVVVTEGVSENSSMDDALAATDLGLLTRVWLGQHTGQDMSEFSSFSFPQMFWGRCVTTVSFFLAPDYKTDNNEEEFLRMAAHFLAAEWERSRLMLHSAHYASLGNIALELSKSILRSITAVRTATDFVRELTDSEEALQGLSIVGENADFLASQSKLFYDLARERKDTVETVALDAYIDQTIELLSAPIKQRGLSIERDFRTDSECVLLNGAALARTFLDLISSVVRTVDTGGTIAIVLKEGEAGHIVCEISHGLTSGELFGLPTVATTPSLLEMVRDHPSFMLAQRTVNSCGGRLSLERESEDTSIFRILLPRNALNASVV
jgi:DNA-binding response OmpR family regulator